MAEQPRYVAIDNQERFLAIVFAEKPDALTRLIEIATLPPYEPATKPPYEPAGKAKQDERDAWVAEWAQTLHLDAPWIVPKAINMLVRVDYVWVVEPFSFRHQGWASSAGESFEEWERTVDNAFARAKRAYTAKVKRRPREERDLHWLYQFQVLQQEYAAIAAAAKLSRQYVREIVLQTAEVIGLPIRTP